MHRYQLLTVDVFHHVLNFGLEGRGDIGIKSALIAAELCVDLRAVLARRTMPQAKKTGRPCFVGLTAVCSIVVLSGVCGVTSADGLIPTCNRIR